MRIVVLTSNAIRHRHVANTLAQYADDAMVVVECKPHDRYPSKKAPWAEHHFNDRYETELRYFGSEPFEARTLPLRHGEVNERDVYDIIWQFQPDLVFVFGASIIKDPLLSLLPGRMINLHLGLSPYYRGSGTNFFPWVRGELEYVGATIHHIDADIDSGDIISHTRPDIQGCIYRDGYLQLEDTVHTLGCKAIKEGVGTLVDVMNVFRQGKTPNRTKQWKESNERLYRQADFTQDALRQYEANLAEAIVDRYLKGPKRDLRLVSLEEA